MPRSGRMRWVEEVIVEIIGPGPVGTTSLEPGRGRQDD